MVKEKLHQAEYTKIQAVIEIRTLLGYCAAYSDNSLPAFRDHLSVLDFLYLEDETGTLSRNVSKDLPLHAA